MFRSINPYTGEVIQEYRGHFEQQVEEILGELAEGQKEWGSSPLSDRTSLFLRLADELEQRKQELALLATLEMGKPISQAIAEIEKCAWLCRHYSSEATSILSSRVIATDAAHSDVRYQPLGLILGIMPWNYPYWQAFRFFVPALIAGNACLLKHASNVTGCALAIEAVLHAVGIPKDVFRSVIIAGKEASSLISDRRISGVSLTGSTDAGRKVGAKAGKNIKPSVLELGGSNAFIVTDSADLDLAVDQALVGRFQNNGQSCIAAKRLLVHDSISSKFEEAFIAKVKNFLVSDPMDPDCDIGPVARKDLAEELQEQMQRSVDKGARLVVGGRVKDALFSPTVLTQVRPGMPAFDEETFGPMAAITTFSNIEEAITLSNTSEFGLGVSVFTSNPDEILEQAHRFQDGALFVNSIVKSDPRLPFGGTKVSGYGRELAEEGMLAFVNRQTIYVS